MQISVGRRRLLGGAGTTLIAITVTGATRTLTPAEALAADAPIHRLTGAERSCLDTMGEIMLPGSPAAGLAHYVDDQLGRASADSLLFARYLDLDIPLPVFYSQGFAAVDGLAVGIGGKPLAELPREDATTLIRSMIDGGIKGWSPAAAALFYTAVRNDAIDVVYGGPHGMELLGIPVMQHAPAPSAW